MITRPGAKKSHVSSPAPSPKAKPPVPRAEVRTEELRDQVAQGHVLHEKEIGILRAAAEDEMRRAGESLLPRWAVERLRNTGNVADACEKKLQELRSELSLLETQVQPSATLTFPDHTSIPRIAILTAFHSVVFGFSCFTTSPSWCM